MRILWLSLSVVLSSCVIPDPVDPADPVSSAAPAAYASSPAAAPTPPAVPAPPPEPATVRVAILSALIGPSKADGHTWDGPGHVSPETSRKVVGALAAANPYAAAAAVLAGLSMGALEKPDPYGYAELIVAGRSARLELPMTFRDTFTPQWAGAEFAGVPLRDNARIRVTLIDKDLEDDDPIGTVELAAEDLRAALHSGHVYPVQVADQSQNQLLFVSVSVSAE